MKLHPLLTASLALLCLAAPTRATLVNASFETGNFTGWRTIGAASVVDATYGTSPFDGQHMGLITTGDGAVTAQQALEFLGIDTSVWDMLLNGYSLNSRASAIISTNRARPYGFTAEALANGGNANPYMKADSIGWILGISLDGRFAAASIGASETNGQSQTPFAYQYGVWSEMWGDASELYTAALIMQREGTLFEDAGAGLLLDALHEPFQSVPDSSATALLLGASMLVLGAFRRSLTV